MNHWCVCRRSPWTAGQAWCASVGSSRLRIGVVRNASKATGQGTRTLELVAIDGLSACAVVRGKVAACGSHVRMCRRDDEKNMYLEA